MASDAGEPVADESALPPLQAGTVIDGFVLIERLHQGGMAHLWRVEREASCGDVDMPLIMKMPRIAGGQDPAAIVGFEVEQMILPTLKGPHVPAFVAKGDFTRRPHIVMEAIAGPTLRPRLDAAPIPIDEIAAIGAKVAAALHDLHRQHVVHLDLKPSNVLFRASGEVVLIDYGLARHAQLPDLLDEEFTLPMGTGPYMSPEQVQFIRNDPRSDLFALGVMLYHFTTGERPFGQPSTVTGLRRRLFVDPTPPRALRRDCPPWLQEVILRCLEVKPELRFQTAAQLALALQYPDQMPLTARADRLQGQGRWHAAKRWFAALREPPQPVARIESPIAQNPILMVAVHVEGATPALLDELRATAARQLATLPGARLACVGVLQTARIGMDELVDASGQSLHLKQLIGLKHWAHPIERDARLDDSRLTFHVLEASDIADALIDFAQRNEVDQIVMGARGTSGLRRYLGSVSSEVVARSACTVTVVRVAS